MKIIYKSYIFSHVEEFLKEHLLGFSDEYVCVLGYLMYSIEELSEIKKTKKLILYQLEQISDHLYAHNILWKEILNMADVVLEYDETNKEKLDLLGIKSILFKFKYTKALHRIRNKNKLDVDILFYGALNDKRVQLIQNIMNANNGRKFIVSQNLFGDQLDEYLSRTKVVLNCHYYEMDIQEQVRIFYPLCNNKIVVSEYNRVNNFGDCIYNVNRQEMPRFINELLRTTSDFNTIGNNKGAHYVHNSL